MVTIFNEDCVSGMVSRLSDRSVDVIVTSPPYNLGIDGTYDDYISRQKYLEWMIDVANEMNRVLSNKGSLFLNLGSKPTDPWVPYDVMNVFRRSFKLQNTFIWVKSVTVEDAKGNISSHGHYKPLNSKRFVNDCWEYVFHLTKGGDVPLDRLALGVPYADKSNVNRWDGVKADLRCRGNVWYVPYETITNHRPHPATFPVQLVKNCLLVHGKDKIRLALDPFMGIGSTGKACRDLGIECVGFEIDTDYYNEAIKGEQQHG
jgi:site-specific DNA-methyltransferase (adenine-specific)